MIFRKGQPICHDDSEIFVAMSRKKLSFASS